MMMSVICRNQQKWTIFKSRIDFDSQPSGETYRHSRSKIERWKKVVLHDFFGWLLDQDRSRQKAKLPAGGTSRMASLLHPASSQNQSDIRNRNAEERNTRNPFSEIPTVVCNCVVATPREQGRFTCPPSPSPLPFLGNRCDGRYMNCCRLKVRQPRASYSKMKHQRQNRKKRNKTRSEKNESICIDDMAFCTSEGIPTLEGLSGNGFVVDLIFKRHLI